jgi:hypothetical protein
MCPFCFGTLGVVLVSTVSTGGVAALAVKIYRTKDHSAERFQTQIKTLKGSSDPTGRSLGASNLNLFSKNA